MRDYNRLARILRDNQKQPADLIGPQGVELAGLCGAYFGPERLAELLGRDALLSQAVDRWNRRSIWVMSRADPAYPGNLKARLKEAAPPILYGCGNHELLQHGGLAVVGSRRVDDEFVRYAEAVGKLSADAQRTIVSGGAKGVDCAAMRGSLEARGRAAGILADSLERASLAPENRDPLLDGRLVLVSPYDPCAGFNAANAVQRNKLIYALADAALVVRADFEKGGTWAGAIEQLGRYHFVPVFVRQAKNTGVGNEALLQRGGLPWPNPRSARELNSALLAAVEAAAAEPKQGSFSFGLQEEPSVY